MKLAVILVLALTACGAKPPTCSASDIKARDALLALYTEAAYRVIDSGACDSYQKVEDCPPYRALEAHLVSVEVTLCRN